MCYFLSLKNARFVCSPGGSASRPSESSPLLSSSLGRQSACSKSLARDSWLRASAGHNNAAGETRSLTRSDLLVRDVQDLLAVRVDAMSRDLLDPDPDHRRSATCSLGGLPSLTISVKDCALDLIALSSVLVKRRHLYPIINSVLHISQPGAFAVEPNLGPVSNDILVLAEKCGSSAGELEARRKPDLKTCAVKPDCLNQAWHRVDLLYRRLQP
jgi:hypothetical protein